MRTLVGAFCVATASLIVFNSWHIVANGENAIHATIPTKSISPDFAATIRGGCWWDMDPPPECPAVQFECDEPLSCFSSEGLPGMWCENNTGMWQNHPEYAGVEDSNLDPNSALDRVNVGNIFCWQTCLCDIACEWDDDEEVWFCTDNINECTDSEMRTEYEEGQERCGLWANMRTYEVMIATANGLPNW